MIKTPESFRHLADGFVYEFCEDYNSLEEFVAMRSRWGSSGIETENVELRGFLTHLIESSYSDAELEAIWDSTRHDFPLTADELRRYLPIMRDNIGLPPPPLKPRR